MLLISEINLKDNEREEAHPGLRCAPLHAVPNNVQMGKQRLATKFGEL